jgi:hypothetical protein
MHETIIHRIDVELAAGVEVTGVASELASDTLSEVLMLLGLDVSEPAERVRRCRRPYHSLPLHRP